MLPRVVDLVLRHPILVIVVFVGLWAGATYHHTHNIRYDFSFRTMAPRDTPQFEISEQFTETFGEDNEIYFIVFRDEPLLTNDNLAMIDRITARIEAIEDTASVNSLTSALDILAAGDALDVSEFVESLPLEDGELEALRARLTNDPVCVGNLISADGTTTALVGRLLEWADDPQVRVSYFEKVEQILEEEGRPGIEFHLSGVPYLDSNLMRHIIADTQRFLPLGLITFAALLWLGFRQIRALWVPLIPIVMASSFTLGSISLSGYPMSVLTGQGVMMTLIMVIGLSDAVHLLNRYAEDVGREPALPRDQTLRTSVYHIGNACFLTSLTTGIGFASLTLSTIPTLREFGIFGSLGILYAFLAAIVLLPAIMVLVERWRTSKPPLPGKPDSLARALDAAADLVLSRPRLLVACGVATLVLSALWSLGVRIDVRFTQDLRAGDRALVALGFVERNLSGVFPLEIEIRGRTPDATKDPAVLAAVDALKQGLEAHPYVTKVVTPVEFVKKMNRAMNEGGADEYRLPDTTEAVAQYLLLFEMAGGDNEFDRMVSYDYSVARMTALLHDRPIEDYREVVRELHRLAEGRFPGDIAVFESGDYPLLSTIFDQLVMSLIKGLYFALPLIFALIALTFRSLKLALITVLPNVLPLTIGMGLLGATDISLRFATMVAFPVAFGLAVDDTIHLLVRYRAELAAGRDVGEAIRTAMRTSGRAMVLTTIFLVAGLGVLLTSNFLAMVHMTVTLCTILVAALFGDLLVLPALLVLSDRWLRRSAEA